MIVRSSYNLVGERENGRDVAWDGREGDFLGRIGLGSYNSDSTEYGVLLLDPGVAIIQKPYEPLGWGLAQISIIESSIPYSVLRSSL